VNTDRATRQGVDGNSIMRCEDIQAVLFDYMTRELGQGRSDLVREHLRRCGKCQTVAAETQNTLDLLHRAARDQSGLPSRLSEKHRARLLWALTHPVLSWIYRHHVSASIIFTATVIALIITLLKGIDVLKTEEPGGVTVTIGEGPHPGVAPPGPAQEP